MPTLVQRILHYLVLVLATTSLCTTMAAAVVIPEENISADRTTSTTTIKSSSSRRHAAGIRGAHFSTQQHQPHQKRLLKNKDNDDRKKNDKEEDREDQVDVSSTSTNDNGNNNDVIIISTSGSNRPNENGLLEPPGGCMSFESAAVQDRARSVLTTDSCRNNACNGGCCRMYNWLICDTSNSFDHLQCVCNANTSPTPNVLSFPTSTPGNAATSHTVDVTFKTAPPIAQPLISTQTPPPTIPIPSPTPFFNGQPTTESTTNNNNNALLPWQSCASGSMFHTTAASSGGRCFYAEDCATEEGECCVRNFCLCANVGSGVDQCVPSRFST